jgi:hypothetical protein
LYETFFSFFTEVNEDANDDEVSKLGASRLVVFGFLMAIEILVRHGREACRDWSINFNMSFHVA